MALQHLRSSTADKRPTPAAMSDGQLALNTNLVSPGLFFKDSNGDSVKIGPVHVGTTAPNVTPGAGGQAGNSKGEQWLDTSSSRYVFKIWDGTAWRSEDGEFVNASGDTMTGALGIIAGTAAAPGVFFSGDTNTGIYSPGADTLAFVEGGVEAMRIDSAGLVGIGTTSPGSTLEVNGTAEAITFQGSDCAQGTNSLSLRALGTGANNGFLQDEFTEIDFNHRRTSDGLASTVARIRSIAETDQTSSWPTSLGFYVRRFGSDFQSFRLESTGAAVFQGPSSEFARIDSSGNILIGQSTTTTPGLGNNTVGICLDDAGTGFFSRAAAVGLRVNRTVDGALVTFASAGTEEGNISISGTTTSYNGAHLSRWSQLSNNAERIEILRGSVLSNIDEMCEWGEEDNEQLNRMKVSDVEGDKNVSGVFQDWDDDDETYTDDFYCAMTGDFIIRIAEGVTVERGDLLMSAGDGTAKPQDDDIIRSKTIAKVTSTNVSCTHADGSYCVPCVLMAC